MLCGDKAHYEIGLWTGYMELKVTILPIQSCSTDGNPISIWSLFHSERR